MFCIDLCKISIDPLSFVYNFAEQETSVLTIFKFQGPFGTQTKLEFFWSQYFPEETI
jgi:hypothetical protein